MIDDAFHPLFRLDMGPLHYFSVLGRALFTAQHLEMNCRGVAAYLKIRKHVAEHGSSILESPDFQEAINQFWNKTLGQHISFLKEKDVIVDEISSIFEEARKARNEIAHFSTIGITVGIPGRPLDLQLNERIEHIRELVRKIASADKIASALIQMINRDPVPWGDFWRSYEDRIEAWVTEETFEE